ncbi:hypothetical protein QNJ24_00115 [Macrococcus caseolyticus]|uniref:hypothetical protein n=1 Tax=Macrococcoides caseolyticum TaxID=69966 RepID=UPI0024BCC045|nr:hypothetical protein [Macrococcus caseolyticus]MDJ1154485.1 hypothetical protein [Macrococcus caseolyticus]
MTYRNKRINRHVHARKPVNSEFEEREQPSIIRNIVKPRTRYPGGEVGRLFNQHIWKSAKYEVGGRIL